jgi:predicted enzyme related to lactoylglutathione lyase
VERVLGIDVQDWGGFSFRAAHDDVTVWSIFEGDSDYWPRDQQAMVNYRVGDLDAMLAQLREAGAEVKEQIEDSEFGRFGWARDPEGNLLELWQPPAGDPD